MSLDAGEGQLLKQHNRTWYLIWLVGDSVYYTSLIVGLITTVLIPLIMFFKLRETWEKGFDWRVIPYAVMAMIVTVVFFTILHLIARYLKGAASDKGKAMGWIIPESNL